MPPSKKQKRSEHHMSDSATAGQQQQQQHQQQRQHCLLLDSGVLSVLLHHTSFIDHHSIICKLLCCSAELSAVVTTQCRGLVTLTSHQQVPPAWIRQHAPLLRCLRVDFSLLSDEARAAAEDSLARVLCEVEPQLLLSGFISKDHYVSVPLLKRLPVSSLTRLVFSQNTHAVSSSNSSSNGQKKQLLLNLAQACRRLSGLRELEVTTVDKGHADYLLPQVAFLKHLTKLHLNVVLSPNKHMATHMPKGLKVLQLTYKNTKHHQPQLDLSKLKSLCHLDLFSAPLRHTDILTPSLTHLSAGSATSLAPLLPLTHLHSLNISAAARLAVSDAPVLPYAELSRLVRVTCLVVSGQVLPPEATLPQALRELQLEGLRDSTKQLTGLQSLTKLRINTLEVDPPALAHLTALTNLAHISCGVVFPPTNLPPWTTSIGTNSVWQGAKLESYLSQWARWSLPLAELSIKGGLLSTKTLRLLGDLKRLTALELQQCRGKVGPLCSPEDMYMRLSDPIRTWTSLQLLCFTGDLWRVDYSTHALEQLSVALVLVADAHELCAPVHATMSAAAAAQLDAAGPVVGDAVRGLAVDAAAAEGKAAEVLGSAREALSSAMRLLEDQETSLVVAAQRKQLTALSSALAAGRDHRWKHWCEALTFSLGSLTQLTALDVSGWRLCGRVSHLRPLTRLRSLNLSGTMQTDYSLLGVLPALSRLTELNIAGNNEITPAPLAGLDLMLPELCVLDVQGVDSLHRQRGSYRGLRKWMLQHTGLTVYWNEP